MFSFLGRSLTLECNLSADGNIRWYDYVYNTEPGQAALIFGENQNVNQAHPISHRLSVDSSGSLTISNLTSDDPGVYFCQSTVGWLTKTQRFKLSLGGECSVHRVLKTPVMGLLRCSKTYGYYCKGFSFYINRKPCMSESEVSCPGQGSHAFISIVTRTYHPQVVKILLMDCKEIFCWY